jgi:hypothetical protein
MTDQTKSTDEVVYLIGSQHVGHAKIGRSNDVDRRFGDIQRSSPVPLSLLWTTEGDHRLESALHHHFASLRIHGEWFDFGDSDPVAAVVEAVEAVKPGLRPFPTEVPIGPPPQIFDLLELVVFPNMASGWPRFGVIRSRSAHEDRASGVARGC